MAAADVVGIAGDAVEAVVDAVHQRVAAVLEDGIARQRRHLLDAGRVHPTEEVVIDAVRVVFVGERRAEEAVIQQVFAVGEVQFGSHPPVLHVFEGRGDGADAVFVRRAFQIRPKFMHIAFAAYGPLLFGGNRQLVFDLGDEGTRTAVAVQADRLDLAFFLVGPGEVVMAEDARLGVVVIDPFAVFPFQLFAEGGATGIVAVAVRVAVANANEAVGDVAGRLDFEAAVAHFRAALVVAVFAPNEVFLAFAIDVVIDAAGARIPAFQCRPVFKGAVLGTPPDEVGAEFFLVFGFVAGGAGFPDAFIAIADGVAVVGGTALQFFAPAVVMRAAKFALFTVLLVVFGRRIQWVFEVSCQPLVSPAVWPLQLAPVLSQSLLSL